LLTTKHRRPWARRVTGNGGWADRFADDRNESCHAGDELRAYDGRPHDRLGAL